MFFGTQKCFYPQCDRIRWRSVLLRSIISIWCRALQHAPWLAGSVASDYKRFLIGVGRQPYGVKRFCSANKMCKYPFIQRNLQLVRTFLDFFWILPEDSKRSWALIIFMLRLLSTWRGNAWRSQCIWKTYSRLTEGSRNKRPCGFIF